MTKFKEFKKKHPLTKENLFILMLAYIISFSPGIILILVGNTGLGLAYFALFSTPIPPMFIILVIPIFLGLKKLFNIYKVNIIKNSKTRLQSKLDTLKRKVKRGRGD